LRSIEYCKRSQDQSSPFRVTFLLLILLVGYQVILTRFPSLRDVALARQVTELTNQRVIFDVNPEPLNPEPMNGYLSLLYLRSDFFQVITLQDITDLDIIEMFNPDAAFITGLYFFDVIFKPPQGGIFAFI